MKYRATASDREAWRGVDGTARSPGFVVLKRRPGGSPLLKKNVYPVSPERGGLGGLHVRSGDL